MPHPKIVDPDESAEEKAESCCKRRWYLRQRRLGNCIKCGNPSDREGKAYCTACLEEQCFRQYEYKARKAER